MRTNVPLLRAAGSTLGNIASGRRWLSNPPPPITVTTQAPHTIRCGIGPGPTFPGLSFTGLFLADLARRTPATTTPIVWHIGQKLTPPYVVLLAHSTADTWDGTVMLRWTRNSDGLILYLPARTYALTI